MKNKSTILLQKRTIDMLKKVKYNPRQTYDEIIQQMSNNFLKMKQRNQYDEFLHKIQQTKMKELWNNKEDEAWENA